MIDMNYPAIVVEKMRQICLEAERLPKKHRDSFVRKVCGLTYEYTSKVVKGKFDKPSTRVLMNMGYEVIVRDMATGEEQICEVNVKCDYNPENPRMNPTSMPVSVKSLEEVYSASELSLLMSQVSRTSTSSNADKFSPAKEPSS